MILILIISKTLVKNLCLYLEIINIDKCDVRLIIFLVRTKHIINTDGDEERKLPAQPIDKAEQTNCC